MKKLRLIKPWHLRTIRQRLSEERELRNIELATFIPCVGPVSDIEFTSYDIINVRSQKNPDGRSSHRNNSPFSSVTFSSANKSIR
ncbi:MAG TPA: hypothetical protein VN721_03990 [Flavipsychrobacter sp.]|nr:hypothetical protein [Flavipsychrobacter sp.]